MKKEFITQINRHQGILRRICNTYFYGNPYREDYYQEMLIRLWKAYPTFHGQSSFATWLYRVALNTAIDLVRKESIRPVHTELSSSEYRLACTDGEHGASPERDRLYQAIGLLSEMEKAVILLFLEGYNYQEIAEIVGISESNTGVKINRIKNKLSKLLGHEKR